LCKFFNTIGRRNASLLTSIKLEEEFKTARKLTQHGPTIMKCLSFAKSFFTTHTFLIRNVCTNLRMLHMNTDESSGYRQHSNPKSKTSLTSPDGPFNNGRKSAEERVADK
jgi:1,4-dihydroxy-2-naphthoyl-CoA synthase